MINKLKTERMSMSMRERERMSMSMRERESE